VTVDLDLLPGGGTLRAEVRAYLEPRHDPMRLADLVSGSPGYDPDVWADLGRKGWLTLGTPQATVAELAVLASELGRARVPTPFQNGVVQPSWAGVPAGTRRVAFCLPGPAGRVTPGALGVTCHRAGAGVRLHGVKRYVPYADTAELLVVVADGPGAGVSLVAVPVPADGVTVETAPSIAGDRQAEVRFDDVHADGDAVIGTLGEAAERVRLAVLVGTVSLCAEAVGASAALVERTTAHALTRVQFGGPIGRLQAVQHRLADMAMDHLAAVGAVDDAVACLDAGRPADVEIAAAKALCGTACLRVAASTHQIWGGTGYLADAGLHHWTRLIKGIDAQLGGAREQRRELARLLAAGGGWSTH